MHWLSHEIYSIASECFSEPQESKSVLPNINDSLSVRSSSYGLLRHGLSRHRFGFFYARLASHPRPPCYCTGCRISPTCFLTSQLTILPAPSDCTPCLLCAVCWALATAYAPIAALVSMLYPPNGWFTPRTLWVVLKMHTVVFYTLFVRSWLLRVIRSPNHPMPSHKQGTGCISEGKKKRNIENIVQQSLAKKVSCEVGCVGKAAWLGAWCILEEYLGSEICFGAAAHTGNLFYAQPLLHCLDIYLYYFLLEFNRGS